MGRGSSGISADTSYQGQKGYSKAASSGKSADNMLSELDKLSENVKNDNQETIEVLKRIANSPNATITMYRATVGDSINNGDWVFLDEAHADRWTRTAFGTPKPNTKVVKKKVKAKDVDWTGKNLEFMYNPKKKSK